MKKNKTIFAMIPARMGSTRLAMKNLALVNGKPLIYYAVRAAKEAGCFDRVIINSEDPLFGRIASRYGAGFYQRPPEWATSSARSDSVVYDFIKHNPCDIVAWVNTTSPLQTGQEVRGAVDHFLDKGLDSLITVKDEQVHCMYKNRPVNFNIKGLFAKTQDLIPVRPFVYSVMMWRTEVFCREFEKNGYAFFCGKFGVYPVSKLSGLIIKREEDLMLADFIMRHISGNRRYRAGYDVLARRRKKAKKR